MKTASSASLLLLLLGSTQAFVTPRPQRQLVVVARQATTVSDASEAIQAAMEATKKYGATSPEARVLWDVVEEMQSGADNEEAMKGGLDSECSVEDVDEACREYDQKMSELSDLMAEYNDKLERLKGLTKDLSTLKVGVNSARAEDSEEVNTALAKAMKEAKAATAEFGASSSQAMLAWETVEEVASAGLGNAMGPRLDQECLVEAAAEACTALEALDKALAAVNDST